MKIKYLVLLLSFMLAACNSLSKQEEAKSLNQASKNQSDENYSGIKQFYDGEILKKEITYKNGTKEGLCKNYYDDGKLKRTIWYANNLKEDTASWYYKEGSVYRATPYSNDKIHGMQIKYYKSGRVQARMPYKHGFRTSGLEEFYDNGLPVDNIPEIKHKTITRDYESDGVVTIVLTLSNESKNVKYYRGGLTDGAFNQNKAKDISASTGMGYVELFKTESGSKSYIDVVAVYTTRFRNKEIIIKRIKLPYNDLR